MSEQPGGGEEPLPQEPGAAAWWNERVDKYSRCPDCARKSVYWVAGRPGEDAYLCRYRACAFHFYTQSYLEFDKVAYNRWLGANATVERPRDKGAGT